MSALSVAPFGWWPLGPLGLAVLAGQLGHRPWRARVASAAAYGLGLYGVGLAWVKEFTLPGMFVFIALVAVQTAACFALVPPGRGRWLGFPAAVAVAELFRGMWPFGGLPLSGLDLGQAGGPLAPVVALGGRLLLAGVVAVLAVAVVAARNGHRRVAGLALAVACAVGGTAWVAPRGHETGRLRVAVVQGGGPRGIRAAHADARAVFDAHLAASARVRRPVDLVLWPEDVVDVERLSTSREGQALSALAARLHTTVVAGIVEEVPPRRFRNMAAVWGPDGRFAGRYEKVHRVPFGEYFPLRSVLEQVATLPADDAVPGPHRPGLLRTPAGPVGVVISFEVFFQGRARSAIAAGGDLLLVPTNASSFTTTQMPAQELAAARLRAWQTGRDTLQAAPTGFSAVVDHRGRVRSHTDLGRRQVLQATVARRAGATPYDRTGDGPTVAVAALALGAAWLVERRTLNFPP